MNLFTKHPQSIGETYWEHFYFASLMGGKMLLAGIACLMHAIFPFLFEKTASNILIQLISQFIQRTKNTDPRIHLIKAQLEKTNS